MIFELVRIAPELGHPRLDVLVVRARVVQRLRRAVGHLGDLRREVAPGLRVPRLHEHRVALDGARHVQQPLGAEVLALHLDGVGVVGVVELPGGRIRVVEGVVLVRVPVGFGQLDELGGALVPLGVAARLGNPEVPRGGLVERRDDVPAGAPPADVIQRRQHARGVVRLAEVGVDRRHQADVPGVHGDRREQRQRLELVAAAAARVRANVRARAADEVGQEEDVQLGALGQPRQANPEVQLRTSGPARVVRVPPRLRVVPEALKEHVQDQLSLLPVAAHRRLRALVVASWR